MPDKQSAVSSLAQRVVTGSLLAAFVTAATLLLPNFWFALLIGAFALVGAWEWSALAGWPSAGRRIVYCAASTLVLLGAAWLLLAAACVPLTWMVARAFSRLDVSLDVIG